VKGKPRGGSHSTQPGRQAQSQSGAVKRKPQSATGTQSAIVGLGIPGVLFGQGLALIPFSFAACTFFMSIAVILSWLVLFQTFREMSKRLAGVLISLALLGTTLWVILVPAPLRAFLFSNPGNYPEGTDIYGIKWKPNFSELSIITSNDSDIDYTHFDVSLRVGPDLAFETGGMAPGINQCSLGIEVPESWLDLRLTSTDKNKPSSIPLLAPTAGSLYRIRCATFLSKSKIDARIAITSRNDQHVEPQWAAMLVDFDASFRHRHHFFKQCFKVNCGDIPETIFDKH
jgi:hypothetical protein